jgi:hypothetical protein
LRLRRLGSFSSRKLRRSERGRLRSIASWSGLGRLRLRLRLLVGRSGKARLLVGGSSRFSPPGECRRWRFRAGRLGYGVRREGGADCSGLRTILLVGQGDRQELREASAADV